MSAKLKILHVIPSIATIRGGPSTALIEMVKALDDQGVDCHIVCSNDNGPDNLKVPIGKLTTYQGVSVRFFERWTSGFHLLDEFAYAKSFKAWLKANIRNYDLVHVHALFSYCSTTAMSMARLFNIPYIVRPIGQLQIWSLRQSNIKKALYLKWVERANIENAALVHCTSEIESRETLKAFPKSRVQTIALGTKIPLIDSQSRSKLVKKFKLDKDRTILITLSRLHPKKGIELLLSSVSKLSKPWQLLIAGNGDPAYVKQLKRLTKELKISDHCHFIGFIEGEIKSLALQGSDLFVLSSYSENFGIAVIESMACETAPLVSREVGLYELISKHKLGFSCEAEVHSITETLKQALQNPTEIEERSLAARSYVAKEFNWANISNQLIDNYQTIIDKQ